MYIELGIPNTTYDLTKAPKKVAPRFARRLFLLLVLMLGRLTSVDLRSYFELAINDNRAQLASQGILQTAQ